MEFSWQKKSLGIPAIHNGDIYFDIILLTVTALCSYTDLHKVKLNFQTLLNFDASPKAAANSQWKWTPLFSFFYLCEVSYGFLVRDDDIIAS